MPLKKAIYVAVVGSMITFSRFSTAHIPHAHAEEYGSEEGSAKLNTLEIAEFALDQTFSADVTQYTATVTNDIETMSLSLVTQTESCLLEINGIEVTSRDLLTYSLSTGENVFEIKVTNGSEVTIYTLTIVRELNEDSSLDNITLSSGMLTFSTTVTSYSVNVENSINQITITPETAADTSTVSVNGTNVDPQIGYTVELPVGKTAITLVVTAENGTKTLYTFTLIREEKTETQPKITEGTSEATSSATTKGQASTTTLVTTGQSGTSRSTSIVQSASTSNGGSQSGTQTETPTTANLSALSVSTGTWNKSFDSEAYTYHIAVDTDVTNVTIAATTEESDATVKIEDGTSTTVSLPNQAKTSISVTVTNDDDRKTYVLVFDKDIDEVSAVKSTKTTESYEAAASVSTETSRQAMSGTQRGQNKPTTQMSNETSESNGSFWDWLKSIFSF